MKRIVLTFPLLLGACGTLPEPFYGDPGVAGAKLAVPPAPVLAIPNLAAAGLDDASGEVYASDLAAALNALDVPSLAGAAKPSEWRLTGKVSTSGGYVTPSYAIIGPDGKNYGVQAGTPVDAASWAAGDPAVLDQQATTDATAISNKLAVINAAVQQSNPNSLENRPPRLFLGPVTGAPGDGDNALTIAMRRDLPSGNTKLVTDQADADFTVTGHIKTQPDAKNQILVELDWVVQDTSHRKIGQVTQLHDLNPADIEPYWGDVAAAAAAEAASGVNEVITNATLRKSKHLASAADSADGDDAPLQIPANFAVPPPAEATNRSLFSLTPAPAPEMVAAAAPAGDLAAPPETAAALPSAAQPASVPDAAATTPSSHPLAAIASLFHATTALAGGLIGRIVQVFTGPAPGPAITVAPAPQLAPPQASNTQEASAMPEQPAPEILAAEPAPQPEPAAAAPAQTAPVAAQHRAAPQPDRRLIASRESRTQPAPAVHPATAPEASMAPAIITPLVYVVPAPRTELVQPISYVPAPAKTSRAVAPVTAPLRQVSDVPGAGPAVLAQAAPPPETGAPIQDPADSIER